MPESQEHEPERSLPLSEVEWEILLALADGPKHGYGILLDVAERGGSELLPGSLYRALNRLERTRWIEEIPETDATRGDSRRRVLRLAPAGRKAAAAEARRLADAVAAAKRRGLLARTGGTA